MKHKYADVIKAWADGEPIQYRLIVNDMVSEWLDVPQEDFGESGLSDFLRFYAKNIEWRVKVYPLYYKVALYHRYGVYSDTHQYWLNIHSQKEFAVVEQTESFVRWVTDVTEVQINDCR